MCVCVNVCVCVKGTLTKFTKLPEGCRENALIGGWGYEGQYIPQVHDGKSIVSRILILISEVLTILLPSEREAYWIPTAISLPYASSTRPQLIGGLYYCLNFPPA